MRKFNNAVGDMDGALASAGNATNKLQRQLSGLTDANDWAVGGVKKLKNIFEGFAFGGALGIVSGGMAAFTQLLIESYEGAGMAAEKLSALNSEIIQQATSWKQLTPAIGGTTAAVVEYYNARLRLAKFEGIQRKSEILEEISHHEQLQKNYEINAKAFPQRTELTRKALEHREAIAKLRMELTSLNTVEGLTELSVNKVNSALAATAKAGASTQEAFNPSFVLDRIRMTEEGLKAAPPSLDVPLNLNWTLLSDTVGLSESFKLAAEEELARLEQMGAPKALGQLGGPQQFDEALLLNTRLQAITKHYEDRVDLMRQLGRSEAEINEIKNQQILAQDEQLAQLRLSLYQGTFGMMSNTMQNLTVVMGKEGGAAFKAMKAFAIAETSIHTYRAAMGAYAALAPIPVVGPALAIAAATAATVAGMARVKQIQSMEPGGAATGSTIGAGGTANPSYSGGSPTAYPVPTRAEERGAQHITVNIQTLDPSSVNWDRMMEDNIKPALERLSGENGRNVELDIKVVKR